MTNWRRAYVSGGTYFFTLITGDRVPILTTPLGRSLCEHVIRNERDLERHLDYIHYNPVKHGLVRRANDWPWISFHRFVREGQYPADWGCAPMDFNDITDTVGE